MSNRQILIATGFAALALACGPGRALAASADAASRRAMEKRIELLEKQNQMLEQQNHAVQDQLSAQKAQIDALRREVEGSVQPVAQLQQEMPEVRQQVAKIEERQSDLPFEVGFRTGWAESPYDMPGGFFYSAYLNHRLLDAEDGIPGGFVSGELMAGVVLGNHAVTGANLYGVLTHSAQSSWLDTIEIQPTVQYHLEPAEWIKPYVLAGPGMWINLLSTPIVVGSKQAGERFRHYDADFQGGGVYGLGFEIPLSALKVAAIQRILNKSHIGAEWRYNEFANGEAFNQYTGSVAFGW